MSSRKSAPVALVGLSAMVAASLLAVRANGPEGEQRIRSEPNAAYVYVADWSGSTEKSRRRLLGAAVAEMDGLPDGTRIVLYRMGSRTEEFYDGNVEGFGTDSVAAALVRGALPTDLARGTDFSKMARALAAFSRSFAGRRFYVRVLTDGGDDLAGNPAARAAYLRSASALCADKRLADIAFYGALPGKREAIRAAFAQAGARLRILDLGQELER